MTEKALTSFVVAREKKQVTMTRIFNAPRELVFKICKDIKLIPQWWGNRDRTLAVDKMDFKPGGAWRYIQKDDSGSEYVFSGPYREIVLPERIVSTYKAPSGQELIKTYVFEEKNERTKLSDIRAFQTVEDLEGTLKAGMELGMRASMERLAELVEKIQNRQPEQYIIPPL
ncbi:MAG TPA: SRPBCC domain-containing protein [Candidatus Limnocylindrales bacterium]|nr:SRPBCC domain-containing protein [Candidatus Limnocylindrales bacterium]